LTGTVAPVAGSPGSPGGIVATPTAPGVVLVDVVAGCWRITPGAVVAVVVVVA
jgi:hypothetical protein